MTYTQNDIDALISCVKKVSDPPRRELRLAGAHWRNDMKLVSVKVDGEFSAFIRRSDDFPENFSIGLNYDPKDGSGEITLIRCNGQHGVFGGPSIRAILIGDTISIGPPKALLLLA
jgi:hypothetical protein